MVFGGTAARSSAIGTANFEEGMLTYLTDVDKLQVYTGATFADVYPAAASTQGLTLINTTSFSAVAGQVLPANTFTSTYTRYRILITATGSTNQYVYMRLRTGSTDSTTAYGNQALYSDSTTTGSVRNTPGYFELSNALRPAGRFIGEIELFNPAAAAITYGYNRVGSIVAVDTTQISMSHHMLIHDVATSYDTANIYTSTGTMTGSVSVYGYNT
jgi:hypothetical protein